MIHEFCRMFLCGELDSYRKRFDLQSVYARTFAGIRYYIGDMSTHDVEEYVVGVGTKLFDERPAEPAYVLTFLEFVLQTSKTMRMLLIVLDVCRTKSRNVNT